MIGSLYLLKALKRNLNSNQLCWAIYAPIIIRADLKKKQTD